MDLPIDIIYIVLDNLNSANRVKFSKINKKTKDIHHNYVRSCLFPKLFKNLVYSNLKKYTDGKADGNVNIEYNNEDGGIILEKLESTMFTVLERKHNYTILKKGKTDEHIYSLPDINLCISSNYFIIIGKNIKTVIIGTQNYVLYKSHYLGNDVVKFKPIDNSIIYHAAWAYDIVITVVADKIYKVYEKVNIFKNSDVDFLQRSRVFIPDTMVYNKRLYKKLNYVSGICAYFTNGIH